MHNLEGMSSSSSPRVRYDPARRQGNANLVAAGGTGQASCSVISSQDIARWERQLLHPAEEQVQRQSDQTRLQELCSTRMKSWPDTLEAKRKQYISDREGRIDAEEKRRQIIDAEEAAYQHTKRQQRLEEAEHQMLMRDPRGMQMRSMVLLDHVMDEQAQQMALKAEKKRDADEAERRFAEAVKAAAVAEEEENRIAALIERDKILAVKLQQQVKLNDMIEDRRAERKAGVLDGELIRQAAQQEERERSQRAAQRREAEVALKRELQLQMSPRSSPRQALETRKELYASQEAPVAEAYEALKAAQKAQLEALVQSRFDKQASKIQQASESWQSTWQQATTPREKAAEVLASAPSLVQVMTDGSRHREEVMSQHRREVAKYSPRGRGIKDTLAERQLEELHSPAYRERLDKQVAMLDRMEFEERLQQREDAKYQSMVQRLQGDEKRRQKEIEIAREKEEAMQRQLAINAEDALFESFIRSKLPTNMSPRLAAKAIAARK